MNGAQKINIIMLLMLAIFTLASLMSAFIQIQMLSLRKAAYINLANETITCQSQHDSKRNNTEGNTSATGNKTR